MLLFWTIANRSWPLRQRRSRISGSGLNAAAQLISNTGNHERGLSQLLQNDLVWLEVPQRVQYKLAVTVHRCLRNQAPAYLAGHCVPVSDVVGRRHLRSAARHQLTVPRICRSTFDTRAFARK